MVDSGVLVHTSVPAAKGSGAFFGTSFVLAYLLHKYRVSLLRLDSSWPPRYCHAARSRRRPGAFGVSNASPACTVVRLLREPPLRSLRSLLRLVPEDPAHTGR